MIRAELDHTQGAFRLAADFQNDAGILALFGPSGSGKSTLVNLIAGLARPSAGRIEVDGTVLVDTARGIFLAPPRRRVGLVYQDALLFPHLSVEQNLFFGRMFTPRAERRIAPGPVIETLGIGHLLKRRPAGLSGGERQRVAIGRALIASPRILLMDEPLAALDQDRKREILPLIERLRDEFAIPIVYVSHAIEEVARLAAKVLILRDGRIAASGPPEDVFGHGLDGDIDRFALASVLTVTAGDYDQAWDLTQLVHPAGAIRVAGPVGRPGETLRVVIRATDVALSAEPPGPSTVRTVLRGLIARIVPGPGAVARVEIELPGGGTVTAAVTRMGLAEIGRTVGDPVHLMVKTVALDERPIG